MKWITSWQTKSIIEIKWIIAFSFLATGDSYNTLAARYRLGVSKVSMIVRNTCDVIWDKLQSEHMAEPKQNDWKKIEHKFYRKWNFPNCLGALDGKHISIRSPAKSGSLYFSITREVFLWC